MLETVETHGLNAPRREAMRLLEAPQRADDEKERMLITGDVVQ